jgi:Toastrack DUF4097
MEKENQTLNDRTIILNMLHEGKLTREETEMLLTALDEIDDSQNKSESMDVLKEKHQKNKNDYSGINFNEKNWMGKEIKSTVEKVNAFIKNSIHFDSPFSIFAEKEEKIHNLQFDTTSVNTIELKNISGTITIIGSIDATEIIVEATVITRTGNINNTESFINQIVIESSLNEGILLITDKFEGQKTGHSWMVNYNIITPPDVNLDISSKSGDIDIENMIDGASLYTISGDIDIESCAGFFQSDTKSGDIQITNLNGESISRSFSGDIELEEITGDIQIENKSGDIALNKTNGDIKSSGISSDINIVEANGKIRSETKSGDITIEETISAGAKIETISGDQDIKIKPLTEAEIKCISVSGDVNLTVPEELTAEISISTISGEIKDEFDIEQEETNNRNSAFGKVGNSEISGKIIIETVSGDIFIKTE